MSSTVTQLVRRLFSEAARKHRPAARRATLSFNVESLESRRLLACGVGDADCNGYFNTTDLVNVFQAGKYEDGIDGNAGWAEGDWDCDGDFTTNDLLAALTEGGYEE